MKRIVIAVVLIAAFIGAAFAQNTSKLANIHKIYLDSLGNEEGSDLVREKIRLRLAKSDRFSVVERAESADAVLTGVAGVVRSTVPVSTVNGSISGGGTHFSGVGVLRLVDTKTDETIWVYEYKRGFSLTGASDRVADKTVEQLLKDSKVPEKKKK
jgi:hypothetical protein